MESKGEELKKIFGKIENILAIIKNLCEQIEQDDKETNGGTIRELSSILKIKDFGQEERDKIVNLLMKYCKNSKKFRAGNIFLNEAEILNKKTILESKPREIHVLLTLKCNLKCIMCCNGYEREYNLEKILYEYLVDNIKYLEKIIWKGGEVFFYDKFFELSEIASKYNVKQHILTNGLLLNKNIMEYICKNNISLVISIDAVEKELYERIRFGGKFEKLIENLKILKSIKENKRDFNYSMNVVLMTLNYNKILEIIKFAQVYGFSSIHFSKCDSGAYNKGVPFLLEEKHLLEIYKQFNTDYIKNLLTNEQGIKIVLDDTFNVSFKSIESKNKNNESEEKKEDEFNFINKEMNFNKLFCDLPWKRIIFNMDTIGFDCHCKVLDISKYFSGKLDIWNCEEIIKYRKDIIDKKEKSCKIFLENNK